MTTPDVNDLFDRTDATIREPRDRFEKSLFFDHIQHTVEGWAQNTYKATVSRTYEGDGTWPLMITERVTDGPADTPITVGDMSLTAWPRAERGSVWIEDRNGHPVVCWSVAGQRNDGPDAPVNPWGLS